MFGWQTLQSTLAHHCYLRSTILASTATIILLFTALPAPRPHVRRSVAAPLITPTPATAVRMSAQDAGRDSQHTAVPQALVSPTSAVTMNDEFAGGFCKQHSSREPRQTASRSPRRGTAIVQWVWSSATGQSGMHGASYDRSGGLSCGEDKPELELVQRLHSQPSQILQQQQQQQQQQERLHGRIRTTSSVFIEKVCEPVRPTRLDFDVTEGKTST